MANTDIYTVIQGLQPTPGEIQKAEAFAQQYLQAQFPDIDLRVGSGLRDLVIRPNATFLALLDKGLQTYFSENTVSNLTDTSPPGIVDAILSNFFLTRKQGSTAIINVRLYFGISKTITLPSTAYFSPDNVNQYNPQATTVILPSDLTYDTNSGEYFYDVNLVSAGTSSTYNINSGSLLYFSTFDTYFLHAEVNYLVTQAIPPETNTQFINRAPSAISTRNLINEPSIKFNLTDNFPSLKHIVSVGAGDPDMIRDTVTIPNPTTSNTGTVHLGGMVDVYCKTPVQNHVEQYTLDSQGQLTFTGPVFNVTRSNVSVGQHQDTLPGTATWTTSYAGYDANLNLTDYANDLAFSEKQSMTLDFGSGNAGLTVSLILLQFTLIDSIQYYLDDPSNRVLCGDYLARAFNCYYLNMTVTSYSPTPITSADIRPTVESYIEGLVPGQTFIMSDLQSEIFDAGYPKIETPINVTYTLYKRDLSTQTGTITNYLDPGDKTAVFILNKLTVNSNTQLTVNG